MVNRNEIIASVNRSWPKDLIIRYLYRELAPSFQRDTNFFRASQEAQYQMYKNGLDCDGTHVICITISEYYKKLYAEFGIESEIIQTNLKPVPHHGLIVHGDIGYYFIDPLKDLGLNQLGCATQFYGIIPLSRTKDNAREYPYLEVLPKEYLKEMDSTLGLLRCGMYMNDFILELHKDLFSRKSYDDILALIGETPKTAGITPGRNMYSSGKYVNDTYVTAKIELMNRYLINLGKVPGPIERQQLYAYIMAHTFTGAERKGLNVQLSSENDIVLTHHAIDADHTYIENKDSDGIYHLGRKK